MIESKAAGFIGVRAMRKLKNVFRFKRNQRRKNEKGASMVEYAIVIGLISIICIVAVRVLGRQVSKQFSNVAGQL